VSIDRATPDAIAEHAAKCFRGAKKSVLLALAQTMEPSITFSKIKRRCNKISDSSLKRALNELHEDGILFYNRKLGQIQKRWNI
jgi:DNA-binding HxlR family transcriptional regulator